MDNSIFLRILNETRVFARRDIFTDEKNEVVNFVKSHKVEIVDRPKNKFALKSLGISWNFFEKWFQNNLEPKNILCVCENYNNWKNEVYIGSIYVKGEQIYMKFTLENEKTVVISFHFQTSKLYVDRTSYNDKDTLLESWLGRWMYAFRKGCTDRSKKISSYYVKDDNSTIVICPKYAISFDSMVDFVSELLKYKPHELYELQKTKNGSPKIRNNGINIEIKVQKIKEKEGDYYDI